MPEWTVEDKRSLLRRPPWFEVYQESVRLPSGRLVEDFYTIAIPDYVVVVGFDPEGKVLAERHYRHGAQAVTWALPSGYVDPGEESEQAARRELREETGYEADSWDLLGRFVVDGNRGCGWANLFVARGLKRAVNEVLRYTGHMSFFIWRRSTAVAATTRRRIAKSSAPTWRGC